METRGHFILLTVYAADSPEPVQGTRSDQWDISTKAMSVVTQQPGAAPGVTISPTGEWGSGMFQCYDDCGICFVGMCCPSILGCYVAHKYGEPFLLGVAPGGLTALRTHMRLSYGIRGTICNDALSMCFCGWCEICRMAREINKRSGTY
ncbi:hypothetical protein NDU88_002039 [Pleurodeles waltl]|uniref:Cornifelin n=1 Tax=Pleurodeles waltl TaxID=8319 RepID=A0AAV7TJK4_PLEWA|nr:hypothetical protein NDU88_002039 [Pleurodeles waltl]